MVNGMGVGFGSSSAELTRPDTDSQFVNCLSDNPLMNVQTFAICPLVDNRDRAEEAEEDLVWNATTSKRTVAKLCVLWIIVIRKRVNSVNKPCLLVSGIK